MIHLLLAFLVTPLVSAEVKAIPPAAEVSASSGPVKLTLRLYQVKISTKEGFWYQIELKNVGKEVIAVSDEIFSNPGAVVNVQWPGIWIQAADPDGKLLPTEHGDLLDCDPWPPPPFINETSEVARLRAEWRAKGLSDVEIRKKLIERQIQLDRRSPGRPPKALRQGESITTPPFAYRGWSYPSKALQCDKKPIAQYAEFVFFAWRKPGRYRVRAVYDYAPRLKSQQNWPRDVRVVTPWLPLEVRP